MNLLICLQKNKERLGVWYGKQKKFLHRWKWVAPKSKQEINVINPATEENCAVISLGNKEDIDYAVSSAKKAFFAELTA